MTSADHKPLDIAKAYQAAASNSYKPKAKESSPYSIRLSVDERAYLKQRAGNRPLSAFIRSQLLGNNVTERRELRRPQINQTQYAALLANLGASRLSANINQLATHANMGTLDLTPEVERELMDACAAVVEMRKALLMALGMKVGR